MILRHLRALLGVALSLAWANLGHAQSTINTGEPSSNSNLTSEVVRQQFQAAASDINGLLSKHAATSTSQCPSTPYPAEDCVTIGSTPYNWYLWTGGTAGWASFATINPSTGVVTIPLNSGEITGSNPVLVTFPSGVATVSLNFNSSLLLDGSNNLGINLANPNVYTATQTFPNGSLTNAELANSTISGMSLGSNLDTLTFGTHLAAGGTSYNGSAAVTISSDATSLNTVSTMVARDSSGNFAAGTITASLTGHASLDLSLSSLGTNVQTALGNALNASNGLVGFSGNIGAATGTSLALSGALTSGVQSSVSGSLVLNWGGGAAATTITNANNGGSPTIQTPNTSGTMAVGAVSPIVENGGTGAISCPTCVWRSTVKVQRTNTSGSATWGAYDAFNNYLTACNTSATACAQAAVGTAFPYAAGTTSLGYDLEFIGGDDAAPGGSNNGGAATELLLNAALTFPAMQGATVTSGAITFTDGNPSTITDALLFNACEMCNLDFRGSQINNHNASGYALHFKPTVGTPLDGNISVSPMYAKFQTIGGNVRFDLSGNAGAAVEYIDLHIVELNAFGPTSGCVLLFDSPASGQNMGLNHVKIEQLHNFGSGSTGLCIGTTTPASGAVLGKSTYDITMSPDATNSANGVDTWGTGDHFVIHTVKFSTGFTLKFESGACNNVAYVYSDQAQPTITDASGCTGENANIWFVNGQMFIGGNSNMATFSGFQTGRYITGRAFNGGVSSTSALSANTLYAMPLILDGAATWTSININVATAGTATSCRLGIFNAASGIPSTLLLDAGTVTVSSTGTVGATISQLLGAGWYYAVVVCNGTVTINAGTVGTNQEFVYAESLGVAALGVSDQQISKSFTFGALSGASPFGTPTFGASSIPIIALKH